MDLQLKSQSKCECQLCSDVHQGILMLKRGADVLRAIPDDKKTEETKKVLEIISKIFKEEGLFQNETTV